MRKAKGLLCTAMIAILAMMQFPTGIQAKEVGGGETTIYVHVPETHAMQLRIGNHGALRIEGKTYTSDAEVNVKRLSNPRFEIVAEKGYKIESVYYQNKNVTKEVSQNIYTAPVLYEDGNIIKVTFKKGSSNPGDGSSSGGGDNSDGNGTEEGGNGSSGSGDNNGGSGDNSSGGGNADEDKKPSDGGSTGGNTGSGSQSGSKDEAEKDEERKDEILGELDKIDEQLKNENLSEGEKAELEKKKEELLQEMTDIIVKGAFTNKSDIEKNLAHIEKLLARGDLSDEQRQLLLKKQKELKKQLEEIENAEKQTTMIAGGLGILVIIVASGGAYIFYKKRKHK